MFGHVYLEICHYCVCCLKICCLIVLLPQRGIVEKAVRLPEAKEKDPSKEGKDEQQPREYRDHRLTRCWKLDG